MVSNTLATNARKAAIYAGEKMNFKNTLRNDSYYNSNFPVRINKEQQED